MIYDSIKNLEIAIDGGFELLYRYKIVDAKEILGLIEKIEQNIPIEIIKVQTQLIRSGKEQIFSILENMKTLVDRSFSIIAKRYIVIKTDEFLANIDNLYAIIPCELQDAKALLKN